MKKTSVTLAAVMALLLQGCFDGSGGSVGYLRPPTSGVGDGGSTQPPTDTQPPEQQPPDNTQTDFVAVAWVYGNDFSDWDNTPPEEIKHLGFSNTGTVMRFSGPLGSTLYTESGRICKNLTSTSSLYSDGYCTFDPLPKDPIHASLHIEVDGETLYVRATINGKELVKNIGKMYFTNRTTYEISSVNPGLNELEHGVNTPGPFDKFGRYISFKATNVVTSQMVFRTIAHVNEGTCFSDGVVEKIEDLRENDSWAQYGFKYVTVNVSDLSYRGFACTLLTPPFYYAAGVEQNSLYFEHHVRLLDSLIPSFGKSEISNRVPMGDVNFIKEYALATDHGWGVMVTYVK
ncbi:hypothetical protein BDW_02345 [Bdellovibrio bacteriovorus W]|nr:hypothetical protein BDW_02345 [Bdellovibrio bacteriovorus W]